MRRNARWSPTAPPDDDARGTRRASAVLHRRAGASLRRRRFGTAAGQAPLQPVPRSLGHAQRPSRRALGECAGSEREGRLGGRRGDDPLRRLGRRHAAARRDAARGAAAQVHHRWRRGGRHRHRGHVLPPRLGPRDGAGNGRGVGGRPHRRLRAVRGRCQCRSLRRDAEQLRHLGLCHPPARGDHAGRVACACRTPPLRRLGGVLQGH